MPLPVRVITLLAVWGVGQVGALFVGFAIPNALAPVSLMPSGEAGAILTSYMDHARCIVGFSR